MAYKNFTNCTEQEYLNIIYSQDDKNRIKIWFNNVELPDAGEYCVSLNETSSVLPSDGSKRFSLANFISKELELVLRDLPESTVIEDQVKISIGTVVDNEYVATTDETYIEYKDYYTYSNNQYTLLIVGTDYEVGDTISGTVYEISDIYEDVPIGIFNIQDTPVTDQNKVTIKLRDNRVKFDFKYNAKPLIELNGGKASYKQILNNICTQAEVTSDITSFNGEDIEVSIYDNTLNATNYIAYIAEQAGAIPVITREGHLNFVYLNDLQHWSIPLSVVEKYELGTPFGIERVVYESGIIKYETDSDEEKETLFLDSANPYINTQEQVENVLPLVKDFKTDSVTTGKVLGNPAIDPYDMIEIYDDEVADSPTTTQTGSEITIENTIEEKMGVIPNAAEIKQQTYTGKNHNVNAENVKATGSNPANIYENLASYDGYNNVVKFTGNCSYTTTNTNSMSPTFDAAKVTGGFKVVTMFLIKSTTMPTQIKLYLGEITGGAVYNTLNYYKDAENGWKWYYTTHTISANPSNTVIRNHIAIVGFVDDIYIAKIQSLIADSPSDFEPYVGGVPSPSPSYPQDIHSISGINKVVVSTINLLDTLATSPKSGGATYSQDLKSVVVDFSNSQDEYFGIRTGMESPTTKAMTLSFVVSGKQDNETIKYRIYGGATAKTLKNGLNVFNIPLGASLSNNRLLFDDADRGGALTSVVSFTDFMLVEGTYTEETMPIYQPYTTQEADIDLSSKNLFNKDNYNIINGYFVGTGTATITSDSNNRIVYIPCKVNTQYTASKIVSKRFGIGYTTTIPTASVSVYNADSNNSGTSISITTGNDAKYLVVYIRNGNVSGEANLDDIINSLQIEVGSTATTYKPYYDYGFMGKMPNTDYENKIVKVKKDIILPEEYTEVEFIECNGNQYIDTGYIPNYNTKITGKFSHNESSIDTPFMGVRTANYTNPYILWSHPTEKNVVGNAIFNNASHQLQDYPMNTIIEFEYSNTGIKYNEQEYTWTPTNDTPNLSLILLGLRNGNSIDGRKFSGKLWKLKIYNNDVLVRDFIPCYRNSDGEIGLYDLANKVFYTNQGTGKFTHGVAYNKWCKKDDIGHIVYNGSESWELAGAYETNVIIIRSEQNLKLASKTMANYFSSSGDNYLTASSSVQNRVQLRIGNDIVGIVSGDNNVQKRQKVQTWLGTHNTDFYYQYNSSIYKEIKGALKEQLDNIEQNLISYNGTTHITQENSDLPFELEVTAYNNSFVLRTLANNKYTFNGVHRQTFDTTIGKEERKENVNIDSEATFRRWAKTEINNLDSSISITTGKVDTMVGIVVGNYQFTKDETFQADKNYYILVEGTEDQYVIYPQYEEYTGDRTGNPYELNLWETETENEYTLTTDTEFVEHKNYYEYDSQEEEYTLYEGARTGDPSALDLYELSEKIIDYSLTEDTTFELGKTYYIRNYEIGANIPANTIYELNGSIIERIDDTADEIKDLIEQNNENLLEQVEETTTAQINESIDAIELSFSTTYATNQDLSSATQQINTDIQKYLRYVQADGRVELGLSTDNVELRLKNNKIYFYDKNGGGNDNLSDESNTNILAYISDKKLYIKSAKFITQVQIGNFAFTPRANGSVSWKKVA